MFERFTEGAMKTIMLAQEEARRLGHNFVGSQQILLGLIGEQGRASSILATVGIDIKNAREEIEKLIGRGSGLVSVEVPFTPGATQILELSWKRARDLGVSHIDTEHLLLALIDNAQNNRFPEGHAVAQVFDALNVDLPVLEKHVMDLKGTKILRVPERPDERRAFATEVIDVGVCKVADDFLCVSIMINDKTKFEFGLEQALAAKLLSQLSRCVVFDKGDISIEDTEKET